MKKAIKMIVKFLQHHQLEGVKGEVQEGEEQLQQEVVDGGEGEDCILFYCFWQYYIPVQNYKLLHHFKVIKIASCCFWNTNILVFHMPFATLEVT